MRACDAAQTRAHRAGPTADAHHFATEARG